MIRTLLAGLLVLAASGCAGGRRGPDGSREISVEAEGWGPLRGDLMAAKRAALADAQKKAVEKAIGVTVRAQTRVVDAVNVRQSIEANLGGMIRRYKVLAEQADGEYYKVLIDATVLYKPRDPGKPLKPTKFAIKVGHEKVAAALRQTLLQYDYPLGSEGEGGSVLVSGVVETYGRSDLRLAGFHSEKATVTLDVADPRSGTTTERSCEGTSLDTDLYAAQNAALEQAGRNCAIVLASMFESP